MKNEKSKHTPGPWDVAGGFVGAQDPKAPPEKRRGAICKTAETGPINYCAAPGSLEDTANAYLIAAAPELLAALEMLQEAFIHKPGDEKGNKARTAPLKYCNAEFSAALNAARAAIAKARGEK